MFDRFLKYFYRITFIFFSEMIFFLFTVEREWGYSTNKIVRYLRTLGINTYVFVMLPSFHRPPPPNRAGGLSRLIPCAREKPPVYNKGRRKKKVLRTATGFGRTKKCSVHSFAGVVFTPAFFRTRFFRNSVGTRPSTGF